MLVAAIGGSHVAGGAALRLATVQREEAVVPAAEVDLAASDFGYGRVALAAL